MASGTKIAAGRNICLAPDTPVLVSDLGYVPACEVKVDFKLVNAKSWGATTVVTKIIRSVAEELIRVDGEIETTAGHPFLSANGRWVPAAEIKVGDWMMGVHGPRCVKSVAVVDRGPIEVLDLVTDAPFLIGGLVTMTKSALLKQRFAPTVGQFILRPQIPSMPVEFGVHSL